MNNYKIEIGGKNIEISIDDLAEQANGSVIVRIGDTLVLATATMSPNDLEGLDFFPLTVAYEERFYATGKILGSRFMRREGRPSESSILTSRLIDRTIRPLFPKGLKREVQIIITCLSFDEENDPDIAGIIATSLALGISDIPWNGPVGAVRIASTKDKLELNPSYEQRKDADYEIIACGIKQDNAVLINMLEAGAKETKEEDILKGVGELSAELDKIVEFEKKIIKENKKEKEKIDIASSKEIDEFIEKNYSKKLEQAMFQPSHIDNKRKMQELNKEIEESVEEKFGEKEIACARESVEFLLEKIIIQNAIKNNKRPDGRGFDEIRKIDSRNNLLPRAHGSSVFIRGATKSLSVVTLGPPGDQLLLQDMEFQGKVRFMHHYNFPPYCSGEVKRLGSPGRREIGHGSLAEKALEPIIPSVENFPYTIRIVTEILSSNGSTSMASVSSASLALMDAGVPIKSPAAGIAMGIMQSGNDYKILTDIQGPEDHFGGMDFKVAGTNQGITAIQLDVKIKGLTLEMLPEILEKAKTARKKILLETGKTLSEPKKELSQYAPKIFKTNINKDKIGMVIGPGGKMINEIIDQCEVEIDIEEDGSIFVTSLKEESAQKAIDWITALTAEAEVGKIYDGTVKKIMDFGAFIEILPGKDGLAHISQLSESRVENVEDVLKLDQKVQVKVISIDNQGRINLSLKEAKKAGK
ncbi:polyribonucleotide nucleotidyltransferase [Patescibacteria group bacterium]|nr:polyribonucleotide nucleotidyltransferase [Patescibacteria group bacterium]